MSLLVLRVNRQVDIPYTLLRQVQGPPMVQNSLKNQTCTHSAQNALYAFESGITC